MVALEEKHLPVSYIFDPKFLNFLYQDNMDKNVNFSIKKFGKKNFLQTAAATLLLSQTRVRELCPE